MSGRSFQARFGLRGFSSGFGFLNKAVITKGTEEMAQLRIAELARITTEKRIQVIDGTAV